MDEFIRAIVNAEPGTEVIVRLISAEEAKEYKTQLKAYTDVSCSSYDTRSRKIVLTKH